MERITIYSEADLDDLDLDYIEAFESERCIRILKGRLNGMRRELAKSDARRRFLLMALLGSVTFIIAVVVVLLLDSHSH